MQRLEVSGAVRLIYRSLGVKGLKHSQVYIFGTDGNGSKLQYYNYNIKPSGLFAEIPF